jgi:hypothetical protein
MPAIDGTLVRPSTPGLPQKLTPIGPPNRKQARKHRGIKLTSGPVAQLQPEFDKIKYVAVRGIG